MEEQELIELGRAGCSSAIGAGAQAADVIVQSSRQVSVEIEKNSVRSCEVEYDAGYCVRAFYNGGAGFFRGRGTGAERLKSAGEGAAAMARACEPDPDFKTLPSPAATEKVNSLFDPASEKFTPAEAIEWGIKCVEAAREIEPDIIVKGGIGAGSGVSAVVNSNGITVFEKASFIGLSVFAIMRKGDKVGSYFEYTQARGMGDLARPEDVARLAAERAVSFVDSKKIETGKFPVVLGPLAANGFIRSIISASSAEEVQRGRTYLADRRGTKIASSLLTVTENPLCPAGLYSASADGEGFPRTRMTLIDSGVLTAYLHNSYTANKSGEENNGHASRGSYGSDIGISATNINIAPGDATESEIIKGIKDGLYVFMGSISPGGVTGQVSGSIDYGFRIINGELAYPVENVMIGGDVFSLLDCLEAVSSDYRAEPGNLMPSILLACCQVSGG